MPFKLLLLFSLFLAVALIWKVNAGRNRSISHNSGNKRLIRIGLNKRSKSKTDRGFYISNGKCTHFDSKPIGNVKKCRPIRRKPAKRSKANMINFRKKPLPAVEKQNKIRADSVKLTRKVKAKKRRIKIRKTEKSQKRPIRLKNGQKLLRKNFDTNDTMPNDQAVPKRSQETSRRVPTRFRKAKKAKARRRKVIKNVNSNVTSNAPTFEHIKSRKRSKYGTGVKGLRKKSSSLKTAENSNQTEAKSKMLTTKPVSKKAPQTFIYEPGSDPVKCYKFNKRRKKIFVSESSCFHYEWTKVNGQQKCRKVVTTGQDLPVEFVEDNKCSNIKDADPVVSSTMNTQYSKSPETELYVYDLSTGCQSLSSQQSNKSKPTTSGKMGRKSGKFRRKVANIKRRRQKRTVKRHEAAIARRKVRKRTKAKARRVNHPTKRRKLRLKNYGKVLPNGKQVTYKSRQECVTANLQKDDPATGQSPVPATYGKSPNKTDDANAKIAISEANKTTTIRAITAATISPAPATSKSVTAKNYVIERKTCGGKDYILRVSDENCMIATDPTACDRVDEETEKDIKLNPEYLVKKFVLKAGNENKELNELQCINRKKCLLCSEEDFEALSAISAATVAPAFVTSKPVTNKNAESSYVISRETCSGKDYILGVSEENCIKAGAGADCYKMDEKTEEKIKNNPEYSVKKFIKNFLQQPEEISELECIKDSKCRLCSKEDFEAFNLSPTKAPTDVQDTTADAKATQVTQKAATAAKVWTQSKSGKVGNKITKNETTTTKKPKPKYRKNRYGSKGGCCSSSSKKQESKSEEESATTTMQPDETVPPNNPHSSSDFVKNPASTDFTDLVCALHSGKQILTVCLIPMDLNTNSECLIQHGIKKGLCFDPNQAAQAVVNGQASVFMSKSHKWKSLKINFMEMKQNDLSGLTNKETSELSPPTFESSNVVIENVSETSGPDKCETMMRTVPVSELVYETIAKECSFSAKIKEIGL